eukprot:m51a1_g13576 hypothetical protein (80) ;mRNA; r:22-1397
MAMELWRFVRALPCGTNIHTALEALRDLAASPPDHQRPTPPVAQRPWYSSPSCSREVALALYRLLGCPPLCKKEVSARP